MPSAAIVIFHHKPNLEWYEEIALDRCRVVFGSRSDVFLACPESLDYARHLELYPGLRVCPFPEDNFDSLVAYNRLKYSRGFYQRFSDFRYLLTYELDAFVFRDELDYWCDTGWSYIGAPWFQDFYKAADDAPIFGVGNSGFSLRSVPDCLAVLSAREKIHTLGDFLVDHRKGGWSARATARSIVKHLVNPVRFADANQRLGINEDLFWGTLVPRGVPEFRVADFATASRFAFDGSPRRLFGMTGQKLPFGCHKWHEIEPDFWYPIIQSHGYKIP